MRALKAAVGIATFCAALTLVLPLVCGARQANTSSERPVVLILTDHALGWKSASEEPGLSKVFKGGAVAALSTAQGETPRDPRIGYVLIGAGSRADTSVLPGRLPDRRAKVPTAFRGPVSTIRAGALGEALRKAGVRSAAVGRRAALAVMDREGKVPAVYPANHPAAGLQRALKGGAKLVAVEARSTAGASESASAALGSGATVAVASPNAGAGSSAALTPFALYIAPGGRSGVLYSPGTRTEGLITNEDLAPTLLKLLGVPEPSGMSGRAAEVRSGEVAQVERLQERITFVKHYRGEVLWMTFLLPGAILSLALVLRRPELLGLAVLTFTALPLGMLLLAAVPTTDPLTSALLSALLAGGVALACWQFFGAAGGLGAVALLSALLIGLDAAAAGRLMRYSVFGYEPAYGTRFYGLGNEYSAILAGAAPLALALVLYRRPKLLPFGVLACTLALVAVGLPVSGADVGGSLALGLGLGTTLGLVHSRRRPGAKQSGISSKVLRVLLWAGGGLALGAALFLAGGLLFPDVSHGARLVSGHSGPLYELVWRKLILSAGNLLHPVWSVLLVAQTTAVFLAWRARAKHDGPLLAGMLGGAVAAFASGALNDAGIVATVLALVFPVAAALMLFSDTRTETPQASPRIGHTMPPGKN